MNRRTCLIASGLAAAFLGLGGQAALAAEFEVHMLDKGEAGTMVFEPAFVKAEPGDVIHFVPVDKGHNVESLKGGLPDGVDSFKSKNNDPFELTVTEAGLYAVKCTPHVGMGMVALIQVGDDASNLDAVQGIKLPKKARERMEALIADNLE